MDTPTATALPLQDLGPSQQQFLKDVLHGLSQPQKSIPSKYFYDEQGSRLFDAICDLPEYYPTRTELAIMREYAADMAAGIGPGALLVELGSGSSVKTRMLLDELESPAGYVPVDISREHLARAAQTLDATYPTLPVLPVCADFLQAFELPTTPTTPRRVVVYFPGSTMGNFERATALRLLKLMRQLAGNGGMLLIGLDLKKDVAVLERAYNDAQGVTATFNFNLLTHVNRELEADFDLDGFRHRAVYNSEHGRVEMHLLSTRSQSVGIAGQQFAFAAGETIHTENSYKYRADVFAEMAASTGFAGDHCWHDAQRWFAVWSFRAV